jgi:outer membrane protein assembly factor BamB
MIAFFVVAVLPLAGFASDWSHWRGPWQTGVSPDTGLPGNVADNVLWRAPYGGRSTPLVLGDRLYMINYQADQLKVGNKVEDVPESILERVLCLDANTGKKIWQHTFPIFHTDVVTSRLGWTNLAADPVTGYIYAHGTQGLFICLDGKTGKVVWQHSLGEEYGRVTGYGGRITSPVVDEDLVIMGMVNSSWGAHAKGANRYVAFEKKTGKIIWWSEPAGVRGTYYSQPVIATINGQRLLISGGADGTIYAIKVRTGEPIWSFPVSLSPLNASPVVEGNMVYIGHGEESPGNAVQGRFVCLDAGTIEKGQPKLVWDVEGLVARYSSPIIHDGRVYVADESCTLFCLDAKTGKKNWKMKYGQSEQRGSPVLADGKIYVGEVGAQFHILKLESGTKKCKSLNNGEFFGGVGGVNVELNGTPAVANGRVYFSTSEEIICIGAKNGVAAPNPPEPPLMIKAGKITHLQIVPGEISLPPGGGATFTARGFDANGNFVKEVKAEWSLPAPPLPKGAKTAPPALKGEITDEGKLTVDAKVPNQGSIVVASFEGLTAKARVRVVAQIPYAPDFSKIPAGAVPGGWINTQGKYLIKTVDGKKVLAKVNDKFSPLISRGNAYITSPTAKDYTIECDVQGTQAGENLPEVGIGANRYSLILVGSVQKLRLQSWEALPRVDKTINFKFQPGVWYRLKLTTDITDGKGVIRGKAWPRDQKEPEAWTVELTDSNPIAEGSALLYGYVTGNFNDLPGTEIYYDNLRITPNKAAGKGAGEGKSSSSASPPEKKGQDQALAIDHTHEYRVVRRPIFPILARMRR